MPASTFAALLAEQVDRSGARPLVTFYDDASGERTELSVVTYANWVAKTAGLLADELDVTRGDVVLVDLPTHWLGPVLLGAAWSVGCEVTDDHRAAGTAALVVCGPDTLEEHTAAGRPVLALSLLPMAARFATPLPAGAVDFGAAVWGQPDSFLAYDPPAAGDVAWRGGSTTLTQAELLEAAGRSELSDFATRLLTDQNPCSGDGLLTLVGPLLAGGGTVWVAHPDADGWDRRSEAEHATRHARRH
jgi:uncharacterized protein (TIGR03089 family)